MFDFVQWYDADTKANCAVGGPNCEFKRFDKGTSTDWRDVAKDGKYGMLRVCDTFLDSLLFSGGECQAQSNSSSCVVDRYDNCGLVISGQGVLPSAYFVDDNGRPDYLKFIDVIRTSLGRFSSSLDPIGEDQESTKKLGDKRSGSIEELLTLQNVQRRINESRKKSIIDLESAGIVKSHKYEDTCAQNFVPRRNKSNSIVEIESEHIVSTGSRSNSIESHFSASPDISNIYDEESIHLKWARAIDALETSLHNHSIKDVKLNLQKLKRANEEDKMCSQNDRLRTENAIRDAQVMLKAFEDASAQRLAQRKQMLAAMETFMLENNALRQCVLRYDAEFAKGSETEEDDGMIDERDSRIIREAHLKLKAFEDASAQRLAQRKQMLAAMETFMLENNAVELRQCVLRYDAEFAKGSETEEDDGMIDERDSRIIREAHLKLKAFEDASAQRLARRKQMIAAMETFMLENNAVELRQSVLRYDAEFAKESETEEDDGTIDERDSRIIREAHLKLKAFEDASAQRLARRKQMIAAMETFMLENNVMHLRECVLRYDDEFGDVKNDEDPFSATLEGAREQLKLLSERELQVTDLLMSALKGATESRSIIKIRRALNDAKRHLRKARIEPSLAADTTPTIERAESLLKALTADKHIDLLNRLRQAIRRRDSSGVRLALLRAKRGCDCSLPDATQMIEDAEDFLTTIERRGSAETHILLHAVGQNLIMFGDFLRLIIAAFNHFSRNIVLKEARARVAVPLWKTVPNFCDQEMRALQMNAALSNGRLKAKLPHLLPATVSAATRKLFEAFWWTVDEKNVVSQTGGYNLDMNLMRREMDRVVAVGKSSFLSKRLYWPQFFMICEHLHLNNTVVHIRDIANAFLQSSTGHIEKDGKRHLRIYVHSLTYNDFVEALFRVSVLLCEKGSMKPNRQHASIADVWDPLLKLIHTYGWRSAATFASEPLPLQRDAIDELRRGIFFHYERGMEMGDSLPPLS
eukprot:g2908.t1